MIWSQSFLVTVGILDKENIIFLTDSQCLTGELWHFSL